MTSRPITLLRGCYPKTDVIRWSYPLSPSPGRRSIDLGHAEGRLQLPRPARGAAIDRRSRRGAQRRILAPVGQPAPLAQIACSIGHGGSRRDRDSPRPPTPMSRTVKEKVKTSRSRTSRRGSSVARADPLSTGCLACAAEVLCGLATTLHRSNCCLAWQQCGRRTMCPTAKASAASAGSQSAARSSSRREFAGSGEGRAGEAG
jgi:hypothetical protein